MIRRIDGDDDPNAHRCQRPTAIRSYLFNRRNADGDDEAL